MAKTGPENRGEDPFAQFRAEPNAMSRVRRVVGIASGKGGVGKSTVTALLAVALQRKGLSVAILDADITGPSIPMAFGIREKAGGTEYGLLPARSAGGIPVMSVNLLLGDETEPVVWRGPILANTVKQFWSDVMWGDVDAMLVDLPPGTGDVPLTVFQSLPIDGIVLVTSPQDLVGMVVQKAANMARKMGVPILAVVENLQHVVCPHCGEEIPLFGETKLRRVAERLGTETAVGLPVDPALAEACDAGTVEAYGERRLDAVADRIAALPEREGLS
jgi:Mrp family chromosome partitioning ATPase